LAYAGQMRPNPAIDRSAQQLPCWVPVPHRGPAPRHCARCAPMRIQSLIIHALATGFANATPCDGIDRSLSKARKGELASALALQLHAENVRVLESLHFGSWYIIFAQPPASDAAHLIFSAEPTNSRYLALFAGAVRSDEGAEIQHSLGSNANGMPKKLANCFVWHLTVERD
jgi:hypothetical protein